MMAKYELQVPVKLIEKIEEIRRQLQLDTKIMERAIELYKEARIRNALVGYSFAEISPAVLFVASIMENQPIPLYKFANVSKVKKTIIWSAASSLYKAGIVKKISRIPDFISLIKEKLSQYLSEEEINKIITSVNKNINNIKRKAGGANPRAIAGAIVWIFSKKKILRKKITQKQAAKIFETNEVSIRNTAKKLYQIIPIY
jgi:transcription initiation factor TFIIIB Brf1 subunit/transcription initiation factor TFIIB